MNKILTTFALALMLMTAPVLGSKRKLGDLGEQPSGAQLKRVHLAQTPAQELRSGLDILGMLPANLDYLILNSISTQDLKTLHRTCELVRLRLYNSTEERGFLEEVAVAPDLDTAKNVSKKLTAYWGTQNGHIRKIAHRFSQIPNSEKTNANSLCVHYSNQVEARVTSGVLTEEGVHCFKELIHTLSNPADKTEQEPYHKWVRATFSLEDFPCIDFQRHENTAWLDLRGLKLNLLNPGIFHLTSLTSLILRDNRINTIPPEIGHLTALKYLGLSGNKLTSFPSGIVQLENLEVLNLSDNELTSLPSEISALTKLIELYFQGNDLTSLPHELLQLVNLEEINVSGNLLNDPTTRGLLKEMKANNPNMDIYY